MSNILLPIQVGTLVDTCWPSTPQEFAVRLAEIMQAVLDGGQGFFNFGSTKPTPDLSIYPWFRTTDSRWYWFSGDWIANHPIVPGSIERRFVVGDAAAIATYDGGDAGAASDRTGPMWEIDTNLTGRLAIGAGTIPGRTIAPTSLSVGQTAGAGEDTLTLAQIPAHTHSVGLKLQTDGAGSDWPEYERAPAGATADSSIDSSSVGGGLPHSTLPPVYAGNWVQRSSRIYFRVP